MSDARLQRCPVCDKGKSRKAHTGELMTEHYETVAATAAEAIMRFINARLVSSDTNPTFTADQLRFYVTNNVVGKVSPSSSDRILRQLRQKGIINYYVVNRGKSLYKAIPVAVDHPLSTPTPDNPATRVLGAVDYIVSGRQPI